MKIEWPQIIMLVAIIADCIYSITNNGRCEPLKFPISSSIMGALTYIAILYSGGFFNKVK